MLLRILVLVCLLLAGCGPMGLGEDPDVAADGTTSKGQSRASVGPITVSLNAGWNPLGFQAATLTSLNPSAAVAGIAYYDGGYQTTSLTMTQINAGEGTRRGFWVYATAATSFSYSGNDAAGVTLNLKSGWNLVSFPGNGAVPGSTLVCRRGGQIVPLVSVVLPSFYQIGPNGNTVVDVSAGGSCQPGQAYWVFASDSVTLGYGSAPASPTPTPVASPTPTPAASASPSPSSGFFTLTTTTINRPSQESFENHEGGWNTTYQTGQIDSYQFHKIAGGGNVTGWFRTRVNWSAPPNTIRPGEVWPLTCTATLLDFKNPLNWSTMIDGNVNGQYVFTDVNGTHIETQVYQNSSLTGNPVGYTVTHNTHAKAPPGGADFDLQIFSLGAGQYWATWYHYKWNP